ncbi:50S ribosomal protein L2 [Candidatus Woesearchaeota archaeon]|nr:50S ribosomal protein L2 [Candidatus Woesearchaeota archaeon]MBW3013757.1 50S ribosomal protein L2 [Candidatus Woesearchaeota archaeon]
MGKRPIIRQRGRSPKYKAHGFKFKAPSRHIPISTEVKKAKVIDLIHCPGHSAPLAKLEFEDGQIAHIVAPENIHVGSSIQYGDTISYDPGCTGPLESLPEGTLVHNIELSPGDGGKLVRSSGVSARIIMKTPEGVVIQLPSKKRKTIDPKCRASIGTVAGGGRLEKPMLKAGKRFHAHRARSKLYPQVCGVSMNAVDHPFGGKSSHHKGKPTQTARRAPRGRKVGKIAPKRTGRKKGK